MPFLFLKISNKKGIKKKSLIEEKFKTRTRFPETLEL